MSTSDYTAQRFGRPRLPKLRAAARATPIPAEVWAVGALVVLAAVIRIITIDNQSFWTDEALTAYEAHLPFGAMLNTVAHVETTPPLYFVLIWCWAHLFGTSEVALRSVSTLAGIALVPIAYLAARDLVSRWAGVIAAAFVAVNPFLVWYSQEARAYMLLAALTGAAFLWFVRARRDPSRRNLVWWAAFSALALMTHFFAGFAIAPEALWLLWISRTRAVAVAVGFVVAAQVAMAPLAFLDSSHGTGWIAATSMIHRIRQTTLEWGVSLLTRRIPLWYGPVGWVILFSLVGLLLLAAGDRRTRAGAAVAAVIATSVMLLPLALALVGQDYFLVRYVIPAFLPLATLVAAACAVPRARVLGGALALALLALFSYATIRVQTDGSLQRPQWRNAARSLGPALVPRAILAASGTSADPLKIYLPGVTWVQLHNRVVLIREVDVVGDTKRIRLLPGHPITTASLGAPTPYGSPVPRKVAPPGATLLSRSKVDSWIVARFSLRRPERVSINRLAELAPRFFIHAPAALLIFTQQPGR